MKPLRADFARSFLRTFLVQGSWNFANYQAGGLAYALLPLLRRIHSGDPVGLRESLRRHLEPFNAHPYLAPLAVGALARLEHDGATEEKVRRAREALGSTLGAFGDRLVWSGWRPLCLLSGVLAYALGAGPWAAVLGALVAYNAGVVGLRAWSFRRGWREGPGAVSALSAGPLRRLRDGLPPAAGAVAGAAAVALAPRLAAVGAVAGTAGRPWAWGLAAAAAGAAFAWPRAGGRASVAALLGAAALALLAG